MGVLGLVLTVLAFSAPILVVTGVTPFIFNFGGIGAPMYFLIAMILLLIFAVGYTTMTRYLPNPGAFYAYITAGLGRPLGLGASFLALLAYMAMGIGTYVFFAVMVKNLVEVVFNGPSIPWWIYAIGCAAVTGFLGYFRVDLSAKVLSVVMACEILIVGVFDLAVLRNGGPQGRTLEPFSFHALTEGSPGLALLFAATCFLGFEATAVYREEVKDPRRTVPRATYIAVGLVGIFYAVAAWLLVVAYGKDHVLKVAETNFAGMFSDATAQYLGIWGRDILNILVVTSAFACVLSVQNILSRYTYSLGVDRVLPSALGRVHPRHGSPYLSSVGVTSVTILALIVIALSTGDLAAVYSQLAGTGGFAVLLLMMLTSVAVLAFFRRRRDIVDASVWSTVVAPGLSAIGLGVVLYLAVTNFTVMTGGQIQVAVGFQVAVWGVFVVGVVTALIFRSRRPSTYRRIGRQE
jgi:amino acid transporter